MNHRVFSKENYYLITNILLNVHMFLLNFRHIYFSFLYLQIRVSKISQPTNIQHPIPITTHNIKQSPLSEPPFQQTKNLQQRNTDLLLISRPGYQTTQAIPLRASCRNLFRRIECSGGPQPLLETGIWRGGARETCSSGG